MKIFWKTTGKRIAAFAMTLLIIAGMIPYGSIVAIAAPDAGADGVEVTPAEDSQTYTITVNGTENGGTVIVTDDDPDTDEDGTAILEGSTRTVIAEPETGYEIAGITVIKNEAAWEPEGAADANWWKTEAYLQDGVFTYQLDGVDADYEFEVTFEKQKIEISYTIGANGTLVLNSDASDDSEKIVLEADSNPSGSEGVDYSTEPYQITAGVKDETYHLTSFVVDGTETLTEDEISNDLNSKDYTFKDGITGSHSVTVTAELDTYEILVEKKYESTGNGNVTVVDGGTLTDNKVQVRHGKSVAFIITPAEGSQIAGMTVEVNGTVVKAEEYPDGTITDIEDGSYKYTFNNVTADTVFSVTFGPYATGNATLEQYHISMKDQNNENLILDGENTGYAEKVVLESTDGNKIRLASKGKYLEQITLTSNQTIETIYLKENKFLFGHENKFTLTPPIQLIIDNTAPVISLTEETTYKNADAVKAEMKGTVQEENLSYVVCANRALSEDEVLTAIASEDIDIIKDFSGSEQSFEVTRSLAEGTDTDSFYLYAVDKVKHCSAEKIVTVKRDRTAPEITKIAITEDGTEKYSCGTFGNTTLTLQITANDLLKDELGSDVNASGIQKIKVYAEGKTDAYYEGEVSTEVNEGASSEIGVLIPIGDAEQFATLSTMKLVAEDRVGNTKEYALTEILDHADILSDKVMLEDHAPEVKLTLGTENTYVETTTGGSRIWYKEIPTVNYQVSDRTQSGSAWKDGSGLAARNIYLNGTELTEQKKTDYTDGVTEYEEVSQIDEASLTPKDLAAMQEGKNVLKIQYTDLAGNVGTKEEKMCLDTTKPRITGFTLEQKNNTIGKILNKLTFGNYANGTVLITVTAEDATDANGMTIPSAGLKDITLYLNGNARMTEPVVNGTAVFELPGKDVLVTDGKVYLNAVVTAAARDNVNNASEECDMTTGNSNLESSHLMIETKKPEANLEIIGGGYQNPKTGVMYSNTDSVIKVKAEDMESGLRSVKAVVNDTTLINQIMPTDSVAELTWEESINTKDAAENAVPGLYEITVTVVDNAGNEFVTKSKVCKDETAPQITNFELEAAGDIEGEIQPFIEEGYGYYFQQNTKVTVYATDGTKESDCGVKEIHFYTVDVDGAKSTEQIHAVNADNAAVFTVEAGFKGQIYATAYDHLMNHPEKAVSPNGLIIETPEQHAKDEHIAFKKPETAYKDSDGKELYADNVTVELTVSDAFSGIRKVEWSVEAPYDTAANQHGTLELDNAGNFMPGSNAEGWTKPGTDKNLVTELKKSIAVTNNSNGIKVSVMMTDRAGNTSAKELELSIDKTKPVIEVTFDNENADPQNTEMYKESRVATIKVTERNFNADEITVNVANTHGTVPGLSNWQTAASTSNPDETVSTATVTFSEDGDYTLEVSGNDSVKNPAEPVKVEGFTIDTTVPVITVTYDNNNAMNGNYYAETRTATVQIEEHNFSSDRVAVTGTATDGGAAITFPGISSWSDNGDVHTATIVCGADGLYRFDVEYSDMAGNDAENYIGEEYYVDMTEPEIEITGVEDMSANNGDVIPRITMSDSNYDTNGVSIELIGANQGSVNPNGAYTAQGNGQIFTFANFPKEQNSDDIYTLNATLTDMAGNESTSSIVFSVNRFGSVYVFDDSLKAIEGTYIQNEIDVKLTEVNVDSLEHDKIRVVVDANGTPKDLVEGTDYTVQETGGNGAWYRYNYIIDKELFANDGRYIVTLYSEDIAGNVNENIQAAKEAEINFGIDKTAPMVVPIDIESNAQYPVDVKRATVAVNDNLVLNDVEVYVGDQKCEYEADGENYTFQISSASDRRDVSIVAVDAAGNRTNYIINGVLVTTNLFVRWYNNKPLFVGSIAGVAVVSGGGIGLATALRTGKIRVKRKKK